MTQQIDSKCDRCEQIADWRLRNPDGYILAAACKTHKETVRADAYAKLRIATA